MCANLNKKKEKKEKNTAKKIYANNFQTKPFLRFLFFSVRIFFRNVSKPTGIKLTSFFPRFTFVFLSHSSHLQQKVFNVITQPSRFVYIRAILFIFIIIFFLYFLRFNNNLLYADEVNTKKHMKKGRRCRSFIYLFLFFRNGRDKKIKNGSLFRKIIQNDFEKNLKRKTFGMIMRNLSKFRICLVYNLASI